MALRVEPARYASTDHSSMFTLMPEPRSAFQRVSLGCVALASHGGVANMAMAINPADKRPVTISLANPSRFIDPSASWTDLAVRSGHAANPDRYRSGLDVNVSSKRSGWHSSRPTSFMEHPTTLRLASQRAVSSVMGLERAKVRFAPILFSNSGSGCQALQ